MAFFFNASVTIMLRLPRKLHAETKEETYDRNADSPTGFGKHILAFWKLYRIETRFD